MELLDITTLGITIAIVSVMTIVVMFIFWRINMELPGVFHWTLGGAMLALAFLSVFLATASGLPPDLGPLLANSLSLAAGLFVIEGSLRFRGNISPLRWRGMLVLMPFLWVILWLVKDSFQLRVLFHDLLLALGMMTTAAILMWKTDDPRQRRFNALAALSAVVLAAGFLWRWQYALVSEDLADGVFNEVNRALFLSLIIFNIGWSYGLGVACYYRSNRQVMELAREDALTGLPNRRSIDERLGTALLETERSGGSFAVIMLDVNGFKQVNDQLGHSVGDELLIAISARLRETIRGSDFVGRLGGDEFLIVAIGLQSNDDSFGFVSRLRQKMNGPMDVCGHSCEVSVSVGMAIWPADGQTVHQLLSIADQRMYADKDDISRRSQKQPT